MRSRWHLASTQTNGPAARRHARLRLLVLDRPAQTLPHAQHARVVASGRYRPETSAELEAALTEPLSLEHHDGKSQPIQNGCGSRHPRVSVEIGGPPPSELLRLVGIELMAARRNVALTRCG